MALTEVTGLGPIMGSDDAILMKMKQEYAANKGAYFQQLREVLSGKAGLSLRVIDWFVTNFSKHHSTCFSVDGQEVLVYQDYHAYMPAKLLCDPFARGAKIQFTPDPSTYDAIETTVGQLNFFYWYFSRKVYEYHLAHQEEVAEDMAKRNVGTKKAARGGAGATVPGTRQRRRRQPLSLAASKTVRRHDVEVIIKFN
jgi:hypothetical protein